VSESLANSSPPYEDAIEVENLEGVPADLSGWYLSDDRASLESLRKFRIPDGSVVPANGRVVFYEEAFNPAGDPQAFGLSSGGEGVYLSATRDGAPTGAIRGFEFPATDDNASFGRVATSEGVELSVLERPTFGAVSPENVEVFREGKGAANAPPRIGDVVINELMIHPSGDGPEWIELLNRSDHAVALGPMGDDAGWRLAGEAEMAFEAGTTLPAGGYLVVSGVDPSAFRSVVAVPPNAQVVGPYVGSLDNAGGEVRLERPVPSASKPGKPAYTWEDRVAYRTALPWPAAADGQGPSMERRGPARFGSDPESWQALTIGGSPGRPNGTIYTLFLPFALDDPE
jgi:hypothetical protein